MKKFAYSAAAMAACAISLTAQAGGHYVPGVEGIQAASVPPPGNYYLGYLVNYNIDSLRAPGSKDAIPGHNKGTVTALANRFVKITNKKVLGADYGFEAIVPVVRKSLTFNAAGISETHSGVADIYLGPVVLGWHGQQWDAVAAAGVWLDNAKSKNPSDPGNGYKSTMLTAGGTYYFDKEKKWSGSALARYEFNGKKDGFRPGQQATVEWGVGRVVGPVQLGIVGYSQVQTTVDKGTGASNDKYARHAVGAEVVYPLMKEAGLMLKAAYYKEVSAKGGTGPQPKGSTARLSLVKVF